MEFNQSNDCESPRNIKLESTSGCYNDDSDLEVIENPSKSQTNDQSDIIDLDDANHAVDLQRMITATQKTIKCPLSMQNIVDPCRSSVCGHTYERKRVLEYLRYHHSTAMEKECVHCPQMGCSKKLKQSDLFDVSLLDKVADDGDNGVESSKDEGSSSEWQCSHCFFTNELDTITKCKLCGLLRDHITDSGSRKRPRSLLFDSEQQEQSSKRQKLDEKDS